MSRDAVSRDAGQTVGETAGEIMGQAVGEPVPDGRRRKGERRRRVLLEATMRLVGREGVAAVSQRAVAAEAGVAPSAVTYHFPTVDALLLAALVRVNDEYVDLLRDCAAGPDPLRRLAELVAACGVDRAAAGEVGPAAAGSPVRHEVAAAYELFLLAGRRPELREEYGRWLAAVDDLLAPLLDDPVRRDGAVAAVDGLFLRVWCAPDGPDADAVDAVLRGLVAP